ncbi:hypothetical protein V1477_008376, partial [Vespula maculifrons]
VVLLIYLDYCRFDDELVHAVNDLQSRKQRQQQQQQQEQPAVRGTAIEPQTLWDYPCVKSDQSLSAIGVGNPSAALESKLSNMLDPST